MSKNLFITRMADYLALVQSGRHDKDNFIQDAAIFCAMCKTSSEALRHLEGHGWDRDAILEGLVYFMELMADSEK